MGAMTEGEAIRGFRDRYRTEATDADVLLERRVFGGDFGANGWTTVDQADDLARRLDLGVGDRLLDLGSGRGWPGLYLARTSGCEVVLSDLPVEGLHCGLARAERDALAGRCRAVAASAAAPPFRDESFDAVVHTDVLC